MALKKRTFLERLRIKYKLVVFNDDTFEEKASFTLNRLNVFVLLSVLTILLVCMVTAMLVLTPLKEYIPGYADVSLRRDINQMAIYTDSLERVLRSNDLYIQNIKDVINGRAGMNDTLNAHSKPSLIDSNVRIGSRPEEDSLLREMIESQNEFDLSVSDSRNKDQGIAGYSFFTPIKGIITEKFNSKTSHYGIDIAASRNEAIKCVLEGTVVFAGWTSETGYVIAVQHNNNLVSIYKHNSVLLKKVGNFVRAGEPIAIVGDTGELSSGPHLHFELWYKGNAVNPKDYINF
jgi:murein DD-endopeptidase MepM/ murein hydrolase activator NlpD